MRGTCSNSPGVIGQQDSAKVWGRLHLWQSGRPVGPGEDAVGRRLEADGRSACPSVDFPRLSKAPPSCRSPRLLLHRPFRPLPHWLRDQRRPYPLLLPALGQPLLLTAASTLRPRSALLGGNCFHKDQLRNKDTRPILHSVCSDSYGRNKLTQNKSDSG